MKQHGLLSLLAALFLAAGAHAADIQRMDPPFWYAGMKNHELQVMFYGKDIAQAEFSLKSYPGVRVKEVAKVKNPNYLFVYLDVTEKARPGTMTFRFKEGRSVTEKAFELRPRNTKTGAQGFSTKDVLYLIMPDRFANGNPANDDWEQFKADRRNGGGHHGGDLQGIRDHLGYIDSLGVTAVWLNPVQYNRSNASHGYAISDFYLIDPRLGTNEEYCGLVDAAHGRNIKVVMDMIFNHSGSSHWWIEDIPDDDWFNQDAYAKKLSERQRQGPPEGGFRRGPRGNDGLTPTTHYKWVLMDPHAPQSEKDVLLDGWFSGGMPDLNQRNRHLATYLIQNSVWWIEYARIDGIRMDTYPYADYDFMVRWCKEIEDEYPDFNIVGEGWYPRNSAAGWWQRGSALNPSDTHLKTVQGLRNRRAGLPDPRSGPCAHLPGQPRHQPLHAAGRSCLEVQAGSGIPRDIPRHPADLLWNGDRHGGSRPAPRGFPRRLEGGPGERLHGGRPHPRPERVLGLRKQAADLAPDLESGHRRPSGPLYAG